MREYEDSSIFYKCVSFGLTMSILTTIISTNVQLGFVIGITSLLVTLAHSEDKHE